MQTSPSGAQAIADAIKSGSTPPVKETTSIGDRLYKVVPKGEGVTGHSPFWIKKTQLDKAISSGNMEQVLGLPLGSHSVHYDVLEISAIKNKAIFNSKIAPTLQNIFETTGGSIQSLVLDRTLWSKPEVIRTIMP